MKIALATLLATLLLPTAGLATDVSVLSWNIRRGIGSNSPNSGEQTYLAKTVNYLKPDIWTINELGGNVAGYSAAAEGTALASFVSSNVTIFGTNPVLGADYFLYVGTTNDGFIGNAIVSRYALTDTRSYSDGLRGLVHANAILPDGAQLGIFTEHLKATTNNANSTSDSQQRQTEAETSLGNLNAWKSANPGSAAVLTGDFNLSQDPGEDDNWTAGNVGDPLPNGHVYQPITTLESAGFLDPKPLSANGDPDTISAASGSNPRNRFDYNLYSSFGNVRYLGGQVFNTAAFPFNGRPAGFDFADSQNASDHLPVFATYAVQAVPEPATLGALALGALTVLRRRGRR